MVNPVFFDNPFIQDLRNFPSEKPVLIHNNTQVKASELYENSIKLATGLKNIGFTTGQRAIVLVQPGIEFTEIIFAIGMLGGIVSLIDPEMGEQLFQSKIEQFNPEWAFVDSGLLLLAEHPIIRFGYRHLIKNSFYIKIPNYCKVISIGRKYPLLRRTIPFNSLKTKTTQNDWVFATENPFLVTYTSGTIAEPKGVLHSIDTLYQSIICINKTPNFKGNIGAYLPHFLLIGICTGNTVTLFNKYLSAKKRIELIKSKKINILFGPPSDFLPMIEFTENRNAKLPSCLQNILLGSAPVYPNFLQRLTGVCDEKTEINCMYGMTENLLVCFTTAKDKCDYTGIGDYLGKPVSNVSINIANDGEILVNSPQLFVRYLHLNTRTTPHQTGDVGYLTEAGELILTGRKKDMIIRRDTNVYPALYEKTILSIPGVKDAAMVGIFNESNQDEKIVLCLESNNLKIKDVYSLLKSGKYSIDKDAMPDEIVFMKIPRTGRQNKVNKALIKQILVK